MINGRRKKLKGIARIAGNLLSFINAMWIEENIVLMNAKVRLLLIPYQLIIIFTQERSGGRYEKLFLCETVIHAKSVKQLTRYCTSIIK